MQDDIKNNIIKYFIIGFIFGSIQPIIFADNITATLIIGMGTLFGILGIIAAIIDTHVKRSRQKSQTKGEKLKWWQKDEF